MRRCKECKEDISDKHKDNTFCSHSCSAKVSNRNRTHTPGRKKVHCIGCDKFVRINKHANPRYARCKACTPFKEDRSLNSGLTYRKDELGAKLALEKKYKTVFTKEHLNGKFFDFANSELLIEYSTNPERGTSLIIKRFEVAAQMKDSRKRVAYLNQQWLGPKRRGKLHQLNVEIHSFLELTQENV
jgi:hypothetical protein